MRRTALTAVALVAGPAAAFGAQIPVAAPGTPGADDVVCAPCATIQGAVARAAVLAGPDEVLIAAGTYPEAVTVAPGNGVTLTGAGVGATLIAPPAPGVALRLPLGGLARGLEVRGRAPAPVLGLVLLEGGELSGVRVVALPAGAPQTGVSMPPGQPAGAIADSEVSLPPDEETTAVGIVTAVGNPVVARSVLRARVGVAGITARPVAVLGSSVIAEQSGIGLFTLLGSLTVQGSLVRVGNAPGATGISVVNGFAQVASSTVVGAGGGSGVSAASITAPSGAIVVNSVVAGFAADLRRESLGLQPAFLGAEHSRFDPALVVSSGPGALDLAGAGNVAGAPGFADPGAGDFTPGPGSALIDAGSPGPLLAGEPAVDLLGRPRLVAGRRDIGAFEVQPAPPPGTVAPPPVLPGATLPPGAPPTRTLPAVRLRISAPRTADLRRPLPVRVRTERRGRVVLAVRTARGRVIGRRVLGVIPAGSRVVGVRLDRRAARPGPAVVSGLQTGGGRYLPARAAQAVVLTPAGGGPLLTVSARAGVSTLVVSGRSAAAGRVVVVARRPSGSVAGRVVIPLAAPGAWSGRLPVAPGPARSLTLTASLVAGAFEARAVRRVAAPR
ncbi:MAG: hypothetical protein MUE51_01505 [Thermoleophilia bacterium]|nr:hypothetical protein [Thermoleophilia bacterium]